MAARTLQTLARQTKAGILTALANGGNPQLVHVQIAVLQSIEALITEAGMDAHHPCFGPDVIGWLAEEKVSAMRGE